MKVGARVIFTTFAVAVGHEGSKVVGKLSVFDVNTAVISIKTAISRHTGGTNTVKGVATEFCTDK